jgi:hypothetical protein
MTRILEILALETMLRSIASRRVLAADDTMQANALDIQHSHVDAERVTLTAALSPADDITLELAHHALVAAHKSLQRTA